MSDITVQFTRIYDQYIEKIYRFVYLKVNSRETAEDITSRAFTKAWEAYQKDAKSIQNTNAFLYKIAGNMVIDHYRQGDKKKTISPEQLPEMLDMGRDIHQTAVFNEDMEKIKKALNGIKKDYQDVIIWHYLEDMDASEIAQLLDRPAGTVRVMIHRGLEMLKDALVQES